MRTAWSGEHAHRGASSDAFETDAPIAVRRDIGERGGRGERGERRRRRRRRRRSRREQHHRVRIELHLGDVPRGSETSCEACEAAVCARECEV